MMVASVETRNADYGMQNTTEPAGQADPHSALRTPHSRFSPWVVSIIVGLGIVIAFNSFYVYVALSNSDPIDPAYVTQPR
jgi:hypothetical protein